MKTSIHQNEGYLPYALHNLGPKSGRTKNPGKYEAKLSFPSGLQYSGSGKLFNKSSYLKKIKMEARKIFKRSTSEKDNYCELPRVVGYEAGSK